MKRTKIIKINGRERKLEITIKQIGDAKYDSEDFNRKFNNLVDDIIITIINKHCHYEYIKN